MLKGYFTPDVVALSTVGFGDEGGEQLLQYY